MSSRVTALPLTPAWQNPSPSPRGRGRFPLSAFGTTPRAAESPMRAFVAMPASSEVLATGERGRLCDQALDLRQGRQQLLEEASVQEERLVQLRQDVDENARRCEEVEEHIRWLQWRLLGTDKSYIEATHQRTELECTLECLQERRGYNGRNEADMRLRLDRFFKEGSAANERHLKLERHVVDSDGQLRDLQAQLQQAMEQLVGVRARSKSAIRALGQGIDSGHRRAEHEADKAVAAMAGSWGTAAELSQAQQELFVLDAQLAAIRSQARTEYEDAERQAGCVRSTIAALVSETNQHAEKANGLETSEQILKGMQKEANACSLRLEQVRKTEQTLRDEVQQERASERDEAVAAAQDIVACGIVEERRLVCVAEHEEQLQQAETDAKFARQGLELDIGDASSAVTRGRARWSAIRNQVDDLERLRRTLQAARDDSELAALRIEEETAAKEFVCGELEQRLYAIRSEHAVLHAESCAANSSSRNREDVAERERRNLELEFEQVKQAQMRQKEFVVAEKVRRATVERRLRQDLFDAEEAWNSSRDSLERRNEALAQRTVLLDDERISAENELHEKQMSLEAFLAAHSNQERDRIVMFEVTKRQTGEDTDNTRAITMRLQREVDELKLERRQCAQAVKGAETLSAGLRAQIGVYQHRQAGLS